MTSPLPPRLRDSRNLADLVRQQKQNARQLDSGLLGGRWSPAKPLGATAQMGDLEDDDPLDDDLPAAINTDVAYATVAGQITLNLTYVPIDGTLLVFWDGDDLHPTEYVLTDQRVTFTDRHIHVGDRLHAVYWYWPSDIPEVALLFDERMADLPLAYYRFDEASGTTIVDSSGNGHDGPGGYVAGYTLGAPSLDTSNPDDGALALDPATSYVVVTYDSWMPVDEITVVGLAKPDSVSVGRVIAARDNNGTVGPWRLGIDSTAHPYFVVFVAGTAYTATASTAVAVGARHDFAGTFDGTAVRVFVDGAEAGSTPASGTIDLNTSQNMWIGRYNAPNGPFDGVLDELAIYDHAVSGDRLLAHAKAAGVA